SPAARPASSASSDASHTPGLRPASLERLPAIPRGRSPVPLLAISTTGEHMRRIPAGLVAVLLTVGLTAACGGDDSGGTVSSPSTTTKASGQNTVTVTASGFKFSP